MFNVKKYLIQPNFDFKESFLLPMQQEGVWSKFSTCKNVS